MRKIIRMVSQKIGLWSFVWRLSIRLNRWCGFDSVPHVGIFGDDDIEFMKLMKKVQNLTLNTQDKCYLLARCLRHTAVLRGDVAECGVYKGGTLYILASLLKSSNKFLHAFDTFAGIPESSGFDTAQVKDFSDTSIESVKKLLAPFDFVDFHAGNIPETFEGIGPDKTFCFVHVDVDNYNATYNCCEFFYERMVAGGIMLFDDYLLPTATKAIEGFFSGLPEKPLPLRSGQCLIIKHAV